MSREKATFESTDLTGVAPTKDDKPQKFLGQERRRHNRRKGQERREDVRFEIGKEDRRKDHGRREEDGGTDFW